LLIDHRLDGPGYGGLAVEADGDDADLHRFILDANPRST
jgi:hypothetical protein